MRMTTSVFETTDHRDKRYFVIGPEDTVRVVGIAFNRVLNKELMYRMVRVPNPFPVYWSWTYKLTTKTLDQFEALWNLSEDWWK